MFSICTKLVCVLLCSATVLIMSAAAFVDKETGLTQTRHDETVTAPDGLSADALLLLGQYQAGANKTIQILNETRAAGINKERAKLLSNLGMAYNKLGRYADAENTLEKSLQMWKALAQTGTDSYARTLNNLGNVYLNERRYSRAEELFKEALALFRSPANESHASENLADIALILSNLGLTDAWVHRFAEAERLLQESLELQRTSNETRNLAATLNNLAFTYRLEGRFDAAARTYSQAIEAWQVRVGYGRPEVAVGFHNLAMVETAVGQTNQAEHHFKQALAIVDASLPAEHPTRSAILSGYAELLKKIGRKHEAKQFLALARTMRAQHEHDNFQDLTVSVQEIAR